MNPKLFALKIMGLLAVTAVVAGCGTSTNPTTGYSLPKGVPVTQNPNHEVTPLKDQMVLPGNAFRVDIPSNLNFVEGQPNSYKISVISMLKGLTYSLQASGLPAGVSLRQIAANQYVIEGTVPVGSSAGQMQGEKTTMSLAAVASGDKASLEKFNSILHAWSPTVTIFPTDKAPMVESQKMDLSVQEGETLPIEIIVTDVGAHGSAMPQIQSPLVDEMQNGEVTFVAALPGIRIARTPVAIGDNKFKFSGTLNTKLLQMPEGKKNLTARFVVNFKSPSGLVSADEIIDVKIVRAAPAQPPAPAAAQPAPAATQPPAPAAAQPAPAATQPSPATKPAPAKRPVVKKPVSKSKTAVKKTEKKETHT